MSGFAPLVDVTTGRSSPAKAQDGVPFFQSAPATLDPVQKLRISSPQALIDTDFEYGLQPTKWEQLFLQNNRQSFFYDPTQPLPVTNITGAGTRVVTVATSTPPAVGTTVYIQNATDNNANGWFYVTAVSAGVSFTYLALANVTNATVYDSTRSYVFSGSAYSQCGIPVNTGAFTSSTTTVTCTTTSAHGLYVGSPIYVFSVTAATSDPPNGAWVVATTPTANTFTFVVATAPVGALSNSANATTLYTRPTGIVESRPYDGGVSFTAGNLANGAQMIRQTRRYFRYQSGKGIQFSTGTSLKPSVFVTSIASSANTVTVTTRFPHYIGINATVTVSGCTQAGFNGTFTVLTTPTPTTFTYAGASSGTQTATGFPMRVTPNSWYGSANRAGIFDSQNGLFFEFDGQTIYAVRRSSINQINGTVTATSGSQVLTGSGTQFSTQLVPGDYIVVRGSSYRILQINSDTSMIIAPQYKGTTVSNVLVSKTVDTRVPQSAWADKCDGTGPSGYNLDLSRMQMFYIDYSWYGAGTARFGFRATNGTIIYVYTFVHNNSQYEAYMRSGNLPSHYESNTVGPNTFLTATATSVATSLTVNDTSMFPPTGTLAITANGASGAIEYVTYTGKTATTFTGLTRAQTGGGSAQTFTYSATAFVTIDLVIPETAAAISHWGSSVIMDGRFDDDKSLIFNSGMTTAISVNAGVTQPIISIRLAPSVDSGFTGVLGVREIINRMQLKMESMGILANGPFLIQARLNGRSSGGVFASAGGSSLAQVAIHTAGQTIAGGENAAAFYTNSSGTSQVLTTIDLTQVRDLGNSILGGGVDNNVPTTVANLYPDGPDVLTITATNIGASAQTILARIGWTEAQA